MSPARFSLRLLRLQESRLHRSSVRYAWRVSTKRRRFRGVGRQRLPVRCDERQSALFVRVRRCRVDELGLGRCHDLDERWHGRDRAGAIVRPHHVVDADHASLDVPPAIQNERLLSILLAHQVVHPLQLSL